MQNILHFFLQTTASQIENKKLGLNKLMGVPLEIDFLWINRVAGVSYMQSTQIILKKIQNLFFLIVKLIYINYKQMIACIQVKI